MHTIHPLKSDAPAIVYIDIKSPYAYLAVEPTRELECALGLQFDWRPFVLDIPSYLGSARLGKGGEVVEQQRSEEQWSGVKYAYFDCRRYARLRDQTIRGTEKIWDTNLISCAMLWMRGRGYAALQTFLDRVYPPFWVRDFDVESETVVAALLAELGEDPQAFLDWVDAEGRALNIELQGQAFGLGVYGVPTYIVDSQMYFGREHLPRVGWHLSGEQGPGPDVSYSLPALMPASRYSARRPEHVCIGVDQSLDSLLALPQLFELLEAYAGTVEWVAIPARTFLREPPAGDESRSALHKLFRLQNHDANQHRYNAGGWEGTQIAVEIQRLLDDRGIELSAQGPEQVLRPAMPGVVIMLDDEPFIGRQHLPLLGWQLTLGG